jgi:YVTN family beta-propeller protein
VSGNPFIVAVSPDQTALFVTTSGGVVERIPLSSGQAVPFDSYTAASNGIAFNPAGSRMYVSTINGTVYEYALPSGNGMRTFSAAGIFQGLAVSEGGTTLHVADENFGLRAWDLTTGGALPPLALSGGPFDLKLTPDGTQLWVSLASGQAVVVLDQATRTVIDTIATGGTPRRIAFDRYGAVALIGNESGWADVVR